MNKPLEPKTCLGCQCEFTPKEPEQKFHDRTCYEKSRFVKTQLEKMAHLPRNSKPQIIHETKKPRYCSICGSESVNEYCAEGCQDLNVKLKVNKEFREKESWAYVLLNGVWIYQPIELALENKAKGCKIFTYSDYLKWKRRQK